MPDSRQKLPGCATRHTPQGSGRKIMLALTFLFVLAAISVSAGLVVYTAWRHDLTNGLFALAFAVLSSKAALSWILWHDSDQHSATDGQQKADR